MSGMYHTTSTVLSDVHSRSDQAVPTWKFKKTDENIWSNWKKHLLVGLLNRG